MKNNCTNSPLGKLGEFGLIEQIKTRVSADARVKLGIGDDCAATTIPADKLLLTTKDLLLENIHFRLDWTDMHSLGRKSAAVNLSDIAAMGGTATQLYLGVGLPADITLESVEQFVSGFLAETGAAGATLCGGDTCRSGGQLIISVTAQGSVAAQHMVTRSGANYGDNVYVSGAIGDSALALSQLLAGKNPTRYISERHHLPTPRLQLGQLLAQRGLATAMIDVSDGLFSDLGHILTQSHCGAVLTEAHIPHSDAVKNHLQHAPQDRQLVLHGGEDYELLFTANKQHSAAIAELSNELNLPLTCIGNIDARDDGFRMINLAGEKITVTTTGFNHFS